MTPKQRTQLVALVLSAVSAAAGGVGTALATGEAGASLPAPGAVRVQVDQNTAQLARIEERQESLARELRELRQDVRELRTLRVAVAP